MRRITNPRLMWLPCSFSEADILLSINHKVSLDLILYAHLDDSLRASTHTYTLYILQCIYTSMSTFIFNTRQAHHKTIYPQYYYHHLYPGDSDPKLARTNEVKLHRQVGERNLSNL